MNITNLKVSKNKSTKNDIKNHLERCNSLFMPELKSYVDIDLYSKKLFERSIRYEYFYFGNLVGLVAVYLSDRIAFISNFSVENEFIGKGVSNKLLNTSINDLKKQNTSFVLLEVFKKNKRALSFYYKYDFIVESEDESKIILKKEL